MHRKIVQINTVLICIIRLIICHLKIKVNKRTVGTIYHKQKAAYQKDNCSNAGKTLSEELALLCFVEKFAHIFPDWHRANTSYRYNNYTALGIPNRIGIPEFITEREHAFQIHRCICQCLRPENNPEQYDHQKCVTVSNCSR